MHFSILFFLNLEPNFDRNEYNLVSLLVPEWCLFVYPYIPNCSESFCFRCVCQTAREWFWVLTYYDNLTHTHTHPSKHSTQSPSHFAFVKHMLLHNYTHCKVCSVSYFACFYICYWFLLKYYINLFCVCVSTRVCRSIYMLTHVTVCTKGSGDASWGSQFSPTMGA